MVDDVTLEEVVTPALVVDRARVLANVEEMAARARSLGVGLRPHAKTHKSPVIAAHQRAHGALGLTVATMSEAEGFADEGIDDLVLSAPPVGDWRLQRLVSLARRVRLRVAVDDAEVVMALERACARAGVRIGYLWELDCGVGRFGTTPGRATAERIAPVADATTHCSFDGLFTFGGHAYRAADRAGLEAAARDEVEAIAETASALVDHGIEARVRSVGSTPTAHVMRDGEGITEIRPGNYVFYDATQVALGLVDLDRCALSVLTTVSSRPARDRLIIDAGSKALAADAVPPPGAGFGRVVGHPELTVVQLYEEQGIVTSAGPCEIPTGTRLRVVPNHACAAVNLHDRMLAREGGAIVDSWPVAFRGWRERGGDREPAGLAAPQT
ncbi:MAG TPA: alanine racemase [Solirubrobacteraceae bacterium]|nr:alanine racemase [Solirubrobacteraceae bacterium]